MMIILGCVLAAFGITLLVSLIGLLLDREYINFQFGQEENEK